MIGPLLVAISWILLRIEGRKISVLGFDKPQQRSIEFLSGFTVAAVFAAGQLLLVGWFSGFSWMLNPDLTVSVVLEGLSWNVNSVLFEELIFRGYLLYKAIELWGPKRACLLSAAAFGVYHWFSQGVFGQLVPMVYLFMMTGLFGLMLAYAFERSKSVVLPVALHLGWNLVSIFVFSNGPIGSQLFIPAISEPTMMSGLEQSVVSILLPVTLPVLVLWVIVRRIDRYRHGGVSLAMTEP
ncbi:CAAX amino terminal protease self- immunity [Microbulbifer aggregans]|uniref:CAAX amino terminal protease self-immunity n=1 Tax=Microbulbifer aggregans TaxID=1769779 RepID=A0A1C9W700_9GAMM|nr:CPBP family intramembrane glutamic endopeptidase [Microbulbifer aggregans]AOS96932.1 CAAX amino terminal protease self- immunity [Microbulbifer aggregans]